MSTAIDLIKAERLHQIKRGYGPDHDDTHTDGSIAAAAAIIASHDICDLHMTCSKSTPMWPMRLFVDVLKDHPTNKIHRLVISAALLVAEIERLKRIEADGEDNADDTDDTVPGLPDALQKALTDNSWPYLVEVSSGIVYACSGASYDPANPEWVHLDGEQMSHPSEDCVGRRTTIVSGRGIDIRISTIVSAVDGDS